MAMQLYHFAHDVLNIHFWDIPAMITLALTGVVAITHTMLHIKREKDFEQKGLVSDKSIRSNVIREDAA